MIKKETEERFWTADLETEGLGGTDIFISWVDSKGEGHVSRDKVTDWLLKVFLTRKNAATVLYFHNGVGFDWKRINFSKLIEAGFQIVPIQNESDILSLKIVKERKKGEEVQRDCWYLQDSYKKVDMKLEDFSRLYSPSLPKLFIDFDRTPFDPENPEHRDYALRDSLCLWHGMKKFNQEWRERFGVDIHRSPTLPSITMKSFRAFAREKNYEFRGVRGHLKKISYESYFGGLVYCLDNRLLKDMYHIDCNSLYGSVMIDHPLPDGEYRYRAPGYKKDWDEDCLVLATVTIPPDVLPMLKTHLGQYEKGKNAETRLGTGIVTGWHWGFELKVQEELGAKIDVHQWVEWLDKTTIVSEFVKKCRDLRMTDYHGPVGMMAKKAQNSLYGKFSQKEGGEDHLLSMDLPSYPDYEFRPDLSEKLDVGGVYAKIRPEDPWYRPNMIHWGSYISARGREKFVRALMKAGIFHVAYGDCDSLVLDRMGIDNAQELDGKNYGEWKHELAFTWFRGIAPKSYEYLEKGKTLPVRVNKGIPNEALTLCPPGKKFDGKPVSYKESPSLKTFLYHPHVRKKSEKRGYLEDKVRTLASEDSCRSGTYVGGIWEPPSIIFTLRDYFASRTTFNPFLDRIEAYYLFRERMRREKNSGKEGNHLENKIQRSAG